MFRAEHKQRIEKQVDAVLARRRFGLGPITDVAVNGDRVAHILRLHDQREAVGQRGGRGM